MFVTPAYAQAATSAAQGGLYERLLQFTPLILIFVIMYFLMIRPQQKKAAEHRRMVEALQKGDVIVTQGGIVGKVVAARPAELDVEIAPQVRVKVLRSTVFQRVDVTAPAAANS